MRFERLKVRDVGVFVGEREWAFNGEPGQLVALSGPNGSGKTTALGLLIGGIYREVPTRGSLMSLARSRDSLVEVDVVNGRALTFRQSCDAVSKKSEALILSDGEPVIPSVKVRDADAWVAENMPRLELLTASIFGAQDGSGFVAASPGNRKHILLEMMDVARLEALSKGARERATEADSEVVKLVGLISAEKARAGDADQLEAELTTARQEADAAEERAKQARAALETAQAEAAKSEAAAQAHRAAIAARRKAEESLRGARAKLADVEQRITNNCAVLHDADAIRNAVKRIEELVGQATAARQRAAMEEQQARAAWADVSTHEGAMTAALGRTESAKKREARAVARTNDRAPQRASESLPELRRRAEDTAAAVNAATIQLDQLRGKQLYGAEDRVQGLRIGLQDIRDGIYGAAATPSDRAAMALDDDDERVEASVQTPLLIREASQNLDEASRQSAKADRELRTAEQLAARLPDMEAAEEELRSAKTDRKAAAAEAKLYLDEARKATQLAEGHGAKAKGYQQDADRLSEEADLLKPLAAKLKPLEGAETRLAELEPQAAEWSETVAELEAELEATPAPEEPAPPPDVEAAVNADHTATMDAALINAEVTRLGERLLVAQQSAERVAKLKEQLDAASVELADWTRLAQDLGRKGLQAALVDSVCAELTELVNSLLHECYGPRWTVSFPTQQPDSTGKKQIEGLWIQVLDTVVGREGPIETYSGGERVFLGEAVALGLATIMCRRLGAERPTFVRDEPAGALDAEKEVAYVAMIRRAAGIIGAQTVLLVSHSEQVKSLCDARIEL